MRKAQPICDLAGLATVAAASAAFLHALVWTNVLSDFWIVFLIALPCMAGASLWAWYVNESARNADAEKWLMGVLFTPLFGAISFAIDVFTGSTNGHYDNFVQAAFHAGSPFGIVLTVLICPVGTILCIGGWVRSVLIESLNPPPTPDS